MAYNTAMTYVDDEIRSQPGVWRRAGVLAGDPAVAALLPVPGERVAVIGCGTSYNMACCFARLREDVGAGETDAWPASELPAGRRYDRLVAISRSGTTTEVLRALDAWHARDPTGSTVSLTADPSAPLARRGHAIVLDFADERSVVQTRFATAALALWRARLGTDLEPIVADAAAVLADADPQVLTDRVRFTFLGTGWTVGLAHEAALKLREASGSWCESYAAMEVRHGPLSVLDDRSVAWIFGTPPPDLERDLAATGCTVVTSRRDPMAHLVAAQLLAVEVARAKGLDPDNPVHLSRSVVLG